MPPWLAAPGGQATMQDLFGQSSSEDEDAPADLARKKSRNPDQAGDTGPGMPATSLQSTEIKAQRLPVTGRPSQPAERAGKLAADGRTSDKQPALASPPRSSSNSATKAQSAALVSKVAPVTGETPEQRKQRIDYSAVAERLKGEPSGGGSLDRQLPFSKSATAKAGSSGVASAAHDRLKSKSLREKANKPGRQGRKNYTRLASSRDKGSRRQGSDVDPWEAAVVMDEDAKAGSESMDPWDALVEDAETPRSESRDAWAAIADSDEDASIASQDDSSAASDSTQQKARAAAAGKHSRGKRKAAHPGSNRKLPKIATIPESLKQALAAQVQPTIPLFPLQSCQCHVWNPATCQIGEFEQITC